MCGKELWVDGLTCFECVAAHAERVGTRPSFRMGTTRMVVGHSRSWTPRLKYEDKVVCAPAREATIAVTPGGVRDGTSTYAGTVRGVDKGRSAHLSVLGTNLAT